jgi:hypothetical protein
MECHETDKKCFVAGFLPTVSYFHCYAFPNRGPKELCISLCVQLRIAVANTFLEHISQDFCILLSFGIVCHRQLIEYRSNSL